MVVSGELNNGRMVGAGWLARDSYKMSKDFNMGHTGFITS